MKMQRAIVSLEKKVCFFLCHIGNTTDNPGVSLGLMLFHIQLMRTPEKSNGVESAAILYCMEFIL